jgi:hypothetical protein
MPQTASSHLHLASTPSFLPARAAAELGHHHQVASAVRSRPSLNKVLVRLLSDIEDES